ncbi:unnamed protein product [Urochloa decumbens]|uniref:Protein kinase domain-containing protein n=1 Tax=Urochloa decumbens TaxID=240449 RepID=A0ABC8ZU93_9POAL
MFWQLFFLTTSILSTTCLLALAAGMAHPGCQERCGNLSIPYPFGIGPGCFRSGLEVTCDHSTGRAYLGSAGSSIWAFDIFLLQGEARVHKHLTWDCYNDTGISDFSRSFMDLRSYQISHTKNKFTAIGCDTIAFIQGENTNSYTSGCMSFCSSKASVDTNGQCTGMGCCQTSIPANLTYFNTTFSTRQSASVQDFNPCSYAFVIETQQFRFDISDLAGYNFAYKYSDGVPLVLNWVAGKESCDEAKKNMSSYACLSKNSKCIPSDSGPGYLCNCSSGYGGNPYLEDGCQDIDECAFPEQYLCLGQCTNTIGSYSCTCPKGTRSSNARTVDCSPYQDPTKTVKMVLGISIGTVFLLVCIFPLVIEYQKRKLVKEKDGFFKQNGGFILLEQMRSGRVDTVRVFSKKELENATNNFDKRRELGRGGHGTVYKGIMKDSRVVAIKRSKVCNTKQKDEFVQEIIILSQINHRNVVRLLGCCLEVEIPILVYEFIPNGTLFQLIHSEGASISLDDRLRIAIESAEALAYLHSSAFPSIIHGDVKSSNILLDDKYMAKVTDFGASHMLAKDETQFMTIVQGTLGYLDPEYLQERQLTEKSDVYSFGVVILELITRKTAIYSEDSSERKGLASSFMVTMKENKLQDMLDKSIVGVGMEPLQAIAELAKKCLSMKGEERPQMTEVVERLKTIRRTWQEKLKEYYATETEKNYAKHSANCPSSIAQCRSITMELEHGR